MFEVDVISANPSLPIRTNDYQSLLIQNDFLPPLADNKMSQEKNAKPPIQSFCLLVVGIAVDARRCNPLDFFFKVWNTKSARCELTTVRHVGPHHSELTEKGKGF